MERKSWGTLISPRIKYAIPVTIQKQQKSSPPPPSPPPPPPRNNFADLINALGYKSSGVGFGERNLSRFRKPRGSLQCGYSAETCQDLQPQCCL